MSAVKKKRIPGFARNDIYWAAGPVYETGPFVKLAQLIKSEGRVALAECAKAFEPAEGRW
jgi:hypothetical protein